MKRKQKKLKKQPCRYKLEDFIHTIPVQFIEEKLNKRDYKKFLKFMTGQTVGMLDLEPHQAGIYLGDLERFLRDMNDTSLAD